MTSRPILLSGYASKKCPRITHNDYDPTVPEPPPMDTPQHLQRLFDLGNAHEPAVFANWLQTGTDVVDLRPVSSSKTAHIAATVQAMTNGRAVILGGRLPDDLIGGRTGKPDVLIRAANGSGYHPVDVKAHMVLEKKHDGGLVADVTAPALADARVSTVGLRYNQDDLLQLAHYWRMLQACHHHAAEPWGAIIGTDSGPGAQLAWYDLTEPLFTTFSRTAGTKKRSALERYDHEHDFRVRVAAVAQQQSGAPADPEPLVQPLGQEDCNTCRWTPVCVDQLPEKDLTRELGGTLSVREYLALRKQAIATVDDLVGADLDTLLDSDYADDTSDRSNRKARLYKAHMSAVLARDGVMLRLKPDAIFDVPRADVEIDLDMESTREGRVYLWGALVTRDGVSSYTAFGEMNVYDAPSELAVAQRCFDWLVATHPSALVFHYHSVEKSHAKRILGAAVSRYTGTVADPESWIDLLPPTRECLDSRDGHSLKFVATESGAFHWRDEDPGGRQSQEWLDEARAGADVAWTRILVYNEDDVLATLQLRKWLRQVTAGLTQPGSTA